jgi:hypothetical protein
MKRKSKEAPGGLQLGFDDYLNGQEVEQKIKEAAEKNGISEKEFILRQNPDYIKSPPKPSVMKRRLQKNIFSENNGDRTAALLEDLRQREQDDPSF